jgi:hypothetical protein
MSTLNFRRFGKVTLSAGPARTCTRPALANNITRQRVQQLAGALTKRADLSKGNRWTSITAPKKGRRKLPQTDWQPKLRAVQCQHPTASIQCNTFIQQSCPPHQSGLLYLGPGDW